jgi:hypothetical protein
MLPPIWSDRGLEHMSEGIESRPVQRPADGAPPISDRPLGAKEKGPGARAKRTEAKD